MVAIQQRARLSQALIEDLRGQIRTGALAPGDRLPTEQQLVSQFGVSRTVVREAISALRANGLVEARQGSGVFVSESGTNFNAGIFLGDLGNIASVLELLELRIPIETEAAGLAAVRRSPRQEAAIRLALDTLGACIARGDAGVDADFQFHMAIVDATNNRFYVDVLRFLGEKTIPRGQLATARGAQTRAYLEDVLAEHAAILDAIVAQDAAAARREMRRHLTGSHRRYHRLMRERQSEAADRA